MKEEVYLFFFDFDTKGRLVIKFNEKKKKEKGKTAKQLNQLQVKKQKRYMNDIQHYVMHAYYIYIYISIIKKETIFIYISIYEEYTALCYACIYYIYMSILCLKMAIYHAFRLMHLDSCCAGRTYA